jgi:hypothetical protein
MIEPLDIEIIEEVTAFPVCLHCRHQISYSKCKAFPNKIPEDILIQGNQHLEPFTGDHGIQFEPVEEVDAS